MINMLTPILESRDNQNDTEISLLHRTYFYVRLLWHYILFLVCLYAFSRYCALISVESHQFVCTCCTLRLYFQDSLLTCLVSIKVQMAAFTVIQMNTRSRTITHEFTLLTTKLPIMTTFSPFHICFCLFEDSVSGVSYFESQIS